MGANIITNDGKAPLVLSERQICSSLKGLVHELPVASAQVKSAILLAGLRSEGSTVVVEPKPSRDHTERMLASMGVNIQQERLKDGQYQISLQPPDVTKLLPLNLCIPGDFSAAAFLLAAGCIVMNSELHLLGVGMNWTRLGMLSALEDMGAQIQLENRAVDSNEEFGDLKIQYASLQGGNIEKTLVVRMIDEFPAFAVVAAFAEGQTIVRGAEELRYKESDRIRGICRGLSKLGVEIKETSHGFILNGSNKDLPGGITLNPNHDHRMAMAYVLAGLRCSNPIIIEDGQIIAQSFPGFIETLVSLGVGSIEVVDD
jgi:3-phosphoshikimate 1-carboxyvinyltransferase